jgi:exodeoxyribonuclease V beta subunit
LQWAIFERIYLPAQETSSDASSLILVGDPKQSIYSFRGADVFTYLRAGQRVQAQHHLGVNRRSSPTVIAAINLAFNSERLGKPSFNQAEILFRLALPNLDKDWSKLGSSFEIVPLEARELSMAELKLRAARVCAGKIEDIRALHPQQVLAVLVFSHGEAAIVEDALEQRGIPCARVSKDSIWQSRWSHELLLLLSALRQPNDEAAVKRALLIEACAQEKSREKFQEKLHHSAVDWARLGAQAALSRLLLKPALSQRSYLAYQQLIELLGSNLDASASISEAEYWLEDRQRDALKSDSNAPWRVHEPFAVQIMTIHFSKGLEFDTVLLPFAWIKENGMRRSQATERHHRFLKGAWHSVVDTAKAPESLAALEQEKMSEDLRLFYVAMTRAKHHLYLFTPSNPKANSPVHYLRLYEQALPSLPAVIDEPGLAGDSGALPTLDPFIASASEQSRFARASDDSLEGPEMSLGSAWTWQSYTGLTQRVQQFGAGRPANLQDVLQVEATQGANPALIVADHEQHVDAQDLLEDLREPGNASQESIRFTFPRGAKAGIALHALFERHPFHEPVPVETLRADLQAAGMPEVLDRLDQVGQWLGEVLATPIPILNNDSLQGLTMRQRMMEFGFVLEMNRLNWPAVVSAVARHFPLSEASTNLVRPGLFDTQASTTHWHSIDGFLKGFMDMVFEWRGKFYILDWKSNFLGSKRSDYKQEAMRLSIAEHDYALQWCLYSVALLRWLRLKMPGDDPLERMGGIVYAFIRGMMGSKQLRSESDGLVPGVYCAQVPRSLLLELDSLVGGTTLAKPLFGQE